MSPGGTGLCTDGPQRNGSRVTYRVETVAGSGNLGDGGPATAAQIGIIQGVATDRSGKPVPLRHGPPQSPQGCTGRADYHPGGDRHCRLWRRRRPGGRGAAQSSLRPRCGPGGLRLHRGPGQQPDTAHFTEGTIVTIAGSGARSGFRDSVPALEAPLLTPRNVAVDAAGNLYISEFEGHRVRRVTPDGRIGVVAGTGIAGLRGDGGPASAAQIGFPAGLAVDRLGFVYVADTQNNRVRRFLPGGNIITALGGTADGPVQTPLALAVDFAGTVYVADSTPLVRAYTAAGVWSDIAGSGAAGFSGDGGPSQSELTQPRDLAVDPAGGLYIADGVRVRRVDTRGFIGTVAGDGYLRSVGDGGAAIGAMLSQPSAVALDAKGSLYIADTGTQRIRQVLPNGVITTLAGSGVASSGPEGMPSAASPLNFPMGVAADLSANVLIADTYNHRIRQVAAGRLSTVVGTGKSGNGADNSPGLSMQLRGPRAVCLDRPGTLYIVDTSNHRVLRAPRNSLVATVAGNGAPGDSGDGGQARAALLNQPSACSVDTSGNLFIADTFSHRIRKVAPSGVITTVAGTGDPGYSGDGTRNRRSHQCAARHRRG